MKKGKRVQFASDDEDGISWTGKRPANESDEDEEESWALEKKSRRNPTLSLDAYSDESENDSDDGGKSDDLKPKSKHRVRIQEQEPAKADAGHAEDDDMFADAAAPSSAAASQGSSQREEIPIIPFNLREEEEEGSYDADGHYTEHKDSMAHHDNWLQGVTQQDIEKAAKAHQRTQKQEHARAQNEAVRAALIHSDVKNIKLRKKLLLEKLCGQMVGLRSTTVPRLLKQLKEIQKKSKKQVLNNAEQENGNSTLSIGEVTDIAQTLLELGHLDIYSDSLDKLQMEIKILTDDLKDEQEEMDRNGRVKRRRVVETEGFFDKKATSTAIPTDSTFEYKFESSGEKFGPFTRSQMKEWSVGGYFANAPAMLCRAVGTNDWRPISYFSDFSR